MKKIIFTAIIVLLMCAPAHATQEFNIDKSSAVLVDPPVGSRIVFFCGPGDMAYASQGNGGGTWQPYTGGMPMRCEDLLRWIKENKDKIE